MAVGKGDRRTWELASQLVQVDSSDPGAYESQIERWTYKWPTKEIEKKAGTLKNRTELIQKEVMPSHFNLMARVPGRGEAVASSLVYICHMDTVMLEGEREENTPTLGVTVEEDCLYGRGVRDMESGLVYAPSALSDMAELAGNTGELPVRPFVLIGTAGEEDFTQGVECAIRDGWVGREDWILDAEPADGQIQVAHKGRTWFELTMQEITAHASNPWKGADAIAAMVKAVCRIRKTIGSRPVYEDLGVSTVTFGQITRGYRPCVMPGFRKVWTDMRLMPSTDTTAAKNIVGEVVEAAEAEIAGVRDSYTVVDNRPYVEKDSDSRFLVSLRSICDRVTGKDTYIGSSNGCTDTAVIAGTLGDRNCMSYGLGSLELAHEPNEYMPYEDMCRCRRVSTELAWQEAFFSSTFQGQMCYSVASLNQRRS